MLERCIHLLQLVIAAGGHGHLEQPSSAMSWEEPSVRAFIRAHACSCIYVATCGYGKDWHKSWLFASTFASLQAIAHQCQHPPGSHQSIIGARSDSGHYLSRETAEYPEQLCSSMASILLPLLSDHRHVLDVTCALQHVRTKDYNAHPFARQDGAGFVSQADWSAPHSGQDIFSNLRKQFSQLIVDGRLDKQIVASFSQHSDSPPFSDDQLQPFRALLGEFLEAQGHVPDWSVPSGQQMFAHSASA